MDYMRNILDTINGEIRSFRLSDVTTWDGIKENKWKVSIIIANSNTMYLYCVPLYFRNYNSGQIHFWLFIGRN